MVVFGGRSEEHEVSLASARAIMEALKSGGHHEVVPMGITREGRWISSGDPMRELESASTGMVGGGGQVRPPPPPAKGEKRVPAGTAAGEVVLSGLPPP